MYYVYEWFIVETGEIIYVGKGTKRRYKVTKHNRLFNEMIKRYNCSSRIIKIFDLEEDAFYYEMVRIDELKEKGQCVCNINRGGNGGTTSWWTDEKRREYSKNNVMKSNDQRERMSKFNPMKNPEIAKKTNSQKRKPVIIGDEEFPSVGIAAKSLNVADDTIINWCKKGININGLKCRYKNEPQKEYTGRYNKGSCKPIIYDGKRYESAVDIAKMLGVTNSAVSLWAKKGISSDGKTCVFEEQIQGKHGNQQLSQGNSD